MPGLLNCSAIRGAMEDKGLNAAAIAKQMGVSREAVSKWLRCKSLPRPDKLLKLALLLDLGPREVTRSAPGSHEPVIAFRKRGAAKTTEEHVFRAKEKGYLLKPLVPYLPFERFLRPPALKQASTDYEYLQQIAKQVRAEAGLSATDSIDFRDLIKRFSEMQAVVVPVLWGHKGHHENALHIFLPESMTTWIYLNLDVEVHDFKFWMAHEFGHTLAPNLSGDPGEDFADAFASALLFPEAAASSAYKDIAAHSNKGVQINRIKKIAEQMLISPLTVYLEANRYAAHRGLDPLDLEAGIYGAAKNLSKKYFSVSESALKSAKPGVEEYVAFARELESPFFEALAAYLREHGKGPGYIQSILDIPLLDARELHAQLA